MLTTERPTKQNKTEHSPITFFEEDSQGVSQPHDDALVVTLVISNYKTGCVLIDNESSKNILYLPAFD